MGDLAVTGLHRGVIVFHSGTPSALAFQILPPFSVRVMSFQYLGENAAS
jgi:hypothetical protein